MRQLLQFDAVIFEVEEELLPNRLCSYLFELSQVFNRFYDYIKSHTCARFCSVFLTALEMVR